MTIYHDFSPEQKEAFQALSLLLQHETSGVYAVSGKAGSGKTLLLAKLYELAKSLNFRIIEPDFEKKKLLGQRSLAILTPTNKASSILRARQVPATTLHRILYRPIYHEEYEAIAEWLSDGGIMPKTELISVEALERAREFYEKTTSVPAALATIGARGSDFIKGWKKRDEKLDIGFIDESSMLDIRQVDDLRQIFNTLVFFGDPAQLAPIGQSNFMVFENINTDKRFHLERVFRQTKDNPILDLAHALADPTLGFEDFNSLINETSRRDDRVQVLDRVETDLMASSPVLVWRNETRRRLIAGFRMAHNIASGELRRGEPLICDGIELPMKHRAKRIDLEARGLIRGAECTFLGEGSRSGFARIYVHGTSEPYLSVASIIQIEQPKDVEPEMISAAKMGASFIHGAATTIHKAQGSQWPQVQIFAPDLGVAARTARIEAGIPLWKRLAYVAVTRAEEKLLWVTNYRMTKPKENLEREFSQISNLKLTAE